MSLVWWVLFLLVTTEDQSRVISHAGLAGDSFLPSKALSRQGHVLSITPTPEDQGNRQEVIKDVLGVPKLLWFDHINFGELNA